MSGREGFASNRVAPQEYRLLSLRIVVDEGLFVSLPHPSARYDTGLRTQMSGIRSDSRSRKGDAMARIKTPYKTYLEENEIPKAWYNLRADMKNKPAPLLNDMLPIW